MPPARSRIRSHETGWSTCESVPRSYAAKVKLCNDAMRRTAQKIVRIVALALLSILVLGLGYAYQRSKFIQKANSLFDPKQKAFDGIFLPWPVGHPTLVGGLDPESDRRIRASLGYDFDSMSSISTNGMTLIIHPSDGTFFVQAD